jgi:hypothetical protein
LCESEIGVEGGCLVPWYLPERRVRGYEGMAIIACPGRWPGRKTAIPVSARGSPTLGVEGNSGPQPLRNSHGRKQANLTAGAPTTSLADSGGGAYDHSWHFEPHHNRTQHVHGVMTELWGLS